MKTKIKNGQEYRLLSDRKQWVMLFTLRNGQKITVKELTKILNCGTQCARSRLTRSSDPKYVFKPRRILPKREGNSKSKYFNPNTWYKDPLVKLMLK